MSTSVPRMTGTALSRNPKILASRGNPTSYVQADANGNMSLVLPSWKPWSNHGPAG